MSLRNKLNNIIKSVPYKSEESWLCNCINHYNKSRKEQKHLCNAPFNSMRFERYGRVLACCHNNTFAAGYYPAESISEIWNGEKLKAFRLLIKENKLEYGCKICKDALVSERYNSVNASMFDSYPVLKEYPSMIDFKADDVCNLDCIMCSPFSSSCKNLDIPVNEKVLFPYDDAFLIQLDDFLPHLKETRFSGGEPFLSTFYRKIWHRVIEINPECIIRIQTNGHFLDEGIKTMLDKGLFSINVSLDSLNEETYKKIRKNGNLEKVLNNIEYFSDYCSRRKTGFGITVCPMRLNYSELAALTAYAGQKNAGLWFSTVYYPIKHSLWSLPTDNLEEIKNVLSKAQLPESTFIEKKNKLIFKELMASVVIWQKLAKERKKGPLADLKLYRKDINDAVNNYFDSMTFLSKEEKEIRKNALMIKTENLLKASQNLKIPQNSLTLLLDYFSPNMFVEMLEPENEERILENLKILALD
ncbi:MAG: radical SAM protein [Bacteroidales bacterium]|nr:radical SAM protein [Bacteroidales bacterium]